MKVFHQLGFRENWNFSVFDNEKVGDGFIFSPVNLAQIKLEKLPDKYKKIGFLDPQCYFPDSTPKGKLSTYDYFPQTISAEIAEVTNCNTEVFERDDIKLKIAEKCIEIQLKNNFEYIVIPFNRIMSDNMALTIEKNQKKYLRPFLDEISKRKIEKKVLLTLVVSDAQIRFEEIRNELLNWVTGIRGIDGVYLIFQSSRKSKQIKIKDILLNELNFIKKLKENDLEVIIGYTNTEALLYSLSMPDGLTMGSYENLRKFTEDRFIDNSNVARAPIARLYSDYLLNWIPSGTINSIREQSLEEFDKLFDKNDERPYNLSDEFNWHFTKPELYKHYFISFYKQIQSLPSKQEERVDFLEKLIDRAIEYYQSSKIPFDMESNEEHLLVWKEVIADFKKRY
ncbi:MAG: hypothetical protein ACRDCE_21610 [Cetobacterium sp.]|uniref:hypothetical protein n=1 Tax=Cetobacterium sp. TaxID=2071632 RepID=UPI003EE74FD7